MQFLETRDTTYLDELLLDERGLLKVVPAATYDEISHNDLMLWCLRHAFYGLPTTELIAFLQAQIGGRSVIEIGAGNGAFGRALGIRMTDSFIQRPGRSGMIDAIYGNLAQPRVQYGADVEELEASEAVRKYKPQVVIGSWITQKVSASLPVPSGGGSIHGVNEEWLLERVQTYIVVGNLDIHGQKKIMRHDPTIIQEPWIKSRSSKPEGNCVLIWGRK